MSTNFERFKLEQMKKRKQNEKLSNQDKDVSQPQKKARSQYIHTPLSSSQLTALDKVSQLNTTTRQLLNPLMAKQSTSQKSTKQRAKPLNLAPPPPKHVIEAEKIEQKKLADAKAAQSDRSSWFISESTGLHLPPFYQPLAIHAEYGYGIGQDNKTPLMLRFTVSSTKDHSIVCDYFINNGQRIGDYRTPQTALTHALMTTSKATAMTISLGKARNYISDIISQRIIIGYNIQHNILDLVQLKHPVWLIRDLSQCTHMFPIIQSSSQPQPTSIHALYTRCTGEQYPVSFKDMPLRATVLSQLYMNNYDHIEPIYVAKHKVRLQQTKVIQTKLWVNIENKKAESLDIIQRRAEAKIKRRLKDQARAERKRQKEDDDRWGNTDTTNNSDSDNDNDDYTDDDSD